MSLVSRLLRTALAKVFLAVVCFAVMIPTMKAQISTATITGLVTDQSGAAIPKATVTATNKQTGIQMNEMSDDTGRYVIPNLAPGTYDVQVAQPGFATMVRRNQEFLVGTRVTIDFALNVASVGQTVEVTDAAPLVETTQSNLSRVVQTQELDNLPILNRGFTSLSELTPGVVANGTSVQFGSSANFQNQVIVDGSSMESWNNSSSALFLNLSQDWIQEFSVVNQQASAEFDNSSAGFLNVTTRSGGNQIHGRAYGYFQNAALNATPDFLPAKQPQKPDYDQQRVGATLGGPIKSDKLFYFLGYEFLHLNQPVPVDIPAAFTTAEASSGVFPATTQTHLAMAKIDDKINDQQSLTIRANVEYDTLGNSGIGINGGTYRPLGYGVGKRNASQSYLATWQDIISPTRINVANVSYLGNYNNAQCNDYSLIGTYPGYPSQPGSTPYGNPTGWYANINYGGPGVITGCPSLYGGQGERDWLFSDTLTISKGKHEIKIGVDAARRHQLARNENRLANGTYTMASSLNVPFDPGFANPGTSNLCGTTCTGYPLSYSVTRTDNNVWSYDNTAPELGLYLEDNFKVGPRLTLNLGLRYNLEIVNTFPTSPLLNKLDNDKGDIQPRAGFAWMPFDKNTVVRGGFGVFTDLSHNIGGVYYGNVITPTTIDKFSATTASANPYCYGSTVCSGGIPLAYQNAVREVLAYSLANYTLPSFPVNGAPFDINVGGNTYTIPALPSAAVLNPPDQYGPFPAAIVNYPQNYKNPRTMQATLGVAHQFGNSMGISADFAYVHGSDEILHTNSNVDPVTYTPINPNFSSINTFSNGGYFNNYSLQMKAHYTDHRGDTIQAAYALSYAYDNSVAQGFGLVTSTTQQTNPLTACNYCEDYGPSDVPRHNLTVSGTFRIPFGINVSPIASFRTGLPYTATTTLRSGALVAACPVYYEACYPAGYTKGSLTQSDLFDIDARISKTFKFREKYSATLLFEGYNVANRSNYTSFGSNIQSANFMQPTGANAMRQLQAGFRFDF
ncbi:MAG TPA: TonB-dependent receptor [Terriglobales bacterium]|jgi:hypothetical protein